MDHYQLSKTIPLNKEYDVIVAGGGPAGCAAAAAAAREGAKTLLIEASGSLGGMGTIGFVPCWCPFSDKEKIIYRGIAQEVFEETKAGMPHLKPDALDWVPIDSEVLKRVYDDLVTGAGSDILFNTFLSGVDFSDGRVNCIIVSNKAGLTAYQADVYIDCTGDADLAAWSGLPFVYGDHGKVQAASHCFLLTNVDEYSYLNGPRLHSSELCPIYDIVDDGEFPLITDGHCCNSLIGPRAVGFNAGHLWEVDSTKPENVSQAYITGRKMAKQLHDGLVKYYPKAFAASHLTATAPAMGIRQSRRIIGEYVLTLEDYAARRSFPDEIGRNCYYIDIHSEKAVWDEKGGVSAPEDNQYKEYAPGESHGIPYRSLIPRGADNLLVAGRAISCDEYVQGSIRVMPPCLVTGQAGGVAAAIASFAKCSVRDISTEVLRKRLRDSGAYFA